MTEKPLVSVIINCYNGEKYLREAIDSVIAQTYENWELVFWDNQSTDSTREIVESYKNPKIRYFYAPEHTPLGEARNLAIERTTGAYISFLDSDDIWETGFLKELVSLMDLQKADLTYCRYINYTKERKWLSDGSNEYNQVTLNQLARGYNIGMSAALIKKRIIDEYNLKFSSSFSLIEDYDFFLRAASVGTVFYSPVTNMRYRVHQSTSVSDRWADEFFLMLNKIKNNDDQYERLSVCVNDIAYLYKCNQLLTFVRRNQKRNAWMAFIRLIPAHPLCLRYFPLILLGEPFYQRIKQRLLSRKYGC